ncbi:unnamed protein product [Gordionus sp. m RMFG-2023]
MKTTTKKKFKSNSVDNVALIPTLAYFQVIGNGSRGSPKSIHLFTNSYRYLFNIGEGAQRLIIEHKCKLSKLSGIFITHSSWDNMGGLPGILLCLRDIGINKVVLHGPPKVENLFIMTKGFMETTNIEIEKYDYHKHYYDDGCLKIEYIPIFNDNPNSLIKTIDYSSSDNSQSETEISSEMKSNAPKRMSTKPTDRDTVIAYIGQLHTKPGMLDIVKCLKCKVPANSYLLGNLKNGLDVVLEDGTIVKSADVKGIDQPGFKFAIVDCPSRDYLNNLVSNASFIEYHRDDDQAIISNQNDSLDSIDKLLKIMVHFTPVDIMLTQEYVGWMQKFGPETSHMVLNESNNGDLSFLDTFRFQAKLNTVHAGIFPFNEQLKHEYTPQQNVVKLFDQHFPPQLNICHGTTMSKYVLRPIEKCGFDISECVRDLSAKKTPGARDLLKKISNGCDIREIIGNDDHGNSLASPTILNGVEREAINNDDDKNKIHAELIYAQAISHMKKQIEDSDMEPNAKLLMDYPQFVFLGTGSAVPNKTRNVSCIWVGLDLNTSILMDCGEGSAGQIIRFFGSLSSSQPPLRYSDENVNRMLRTLKCVFVSHLHADHHLGLVQIINERRQAFRDTDVNYKSDLSLSSELGKDIPKLMVVAPKGLMNFLRPYSNKHQHILTDIKFMPSHNFQPDMVDEYLHALICSHLNLKQFLTIPVYHYKSPYGLSFTTNDQISVDKTDKTFQNSSITTTNSKKIVYSGDTIPCENLINYGENADLLIHEATMENSLTTEAFTKRHSTISQAIDTGHKMKAKFILLTHFSQRYSKMPLYGTSSEVQDSTDGSVVNQERQLKNVGIAFDNMKVKFNELSILPHLIPPLKVLFADDMLEMEERTSKLVHRKKMSWV